MQATDLQDKNAPEFELPDQDGKIHKLSDYKGQWLVVYFYPKDDTPGCTTEACSFRDNLADLKELGVQIIGISKDTIESHRKFADKYSLNFTLLANPNKETIMAYGSWGLKSFMGKQSEGTLRNSYLINPEGIVVKVYQGVKPQQHVAQIMEDFKQIKTFQNGS